MSDVAHGPLLSVLWNVCSTLSVKYHRMFFYFFLFWHSYRIDESIELHLHVIRFIFKNIYQQLFQNYAILSLWTSGLKSVHGFISTGKYFHSMKFLDLKLDKVIFFLIKSLLFLEFCHTDIDLLQLPEQNRMIPNCLPLIWWFLFCIFYSWNSFVRVPRNWRYIVYAYLGGLYVPFLLLWPALIILASVYSGKSSDPCILVTD